MSEDDQFWTDLVNYLPPRDLFEEIDLEDAQAMLDAGLDADEEVTLTEEEIARYAEVLRAACANSNEGDVLSFTEQDRKSEASETQRSGISVADDEAKTAKTIPLFPWVRMAAAASLLIGGFLAGRFADGPGSIDVAPPSGILIASVSFERGRGATERASIKVESDTKGFVSFLTLNDRQARPFVYPLEEDMPVEPGVPVRSGPIPEEAENALVALAVVTHTPAADVLDRALVNDNFSSDQIDAFEQRVREVLRGKGYRQSALIRVSLKPLE